MRGDRPYSVDEIEIAQTGQGENWTNSQHVAPSVCLSHAEVTNSLASLLKIPGERPHLDGEVGKGSPSGRSKCPGQSGNKKPWCEFASDAVDPRAAAAGMAVDHCAIIASTQASTMEPCCHAVVMLCWISRYSVHPTSRECDPVGHVVVVSLDRASERGSDVSNSQHGSATRAEMTNTFLTC